MNRYATVDIADLQRAEQRYTSQSVDRRAIMTYVARQRGLRCCGP